MVLKVSWMLIGNTDANILKVSLTEKDATKENKLT